jgi:fucose permease
LVWAVAWVAIALLYLSRLPVDEHKSTHSETKLSPSFWAYWSLLGLSVGVEFCFGVWGASFLEKITGLMRDDAIIGSTAFAACVLTGRLIGVYIIGRTGPWRLALASLLITLAGFFVFWLSSPPAFVLIGLGLSGFGVANLFAAALTLALAAEPGNATKAASRTPLATGLAIILTPLLLGALADSVGLFAGYAIVPLLIGMCLAALFLGRSTLAANAF